MAAKSFDKPVVGPLAGLISVVPVSRAIDNMKAAKGTIFLPDPIENPTLLRGIGTKFDGPGFEVGGTIYLPVVNGESHKLEITEIRGPTDIVLKSTALPQNAIDQLLSADGVSFKFAPHVDQARVYDAVFDRLQKEGCIGIFPEGGSHDRPDLLPLKGERPCVKVKDLLLIGS
jgi:glycerol-3-phosphate O-acyltransferase/dihydroxyacetone phosphate acyltransferase